MFLVFVKFQGVAILEISILLVVFCRVMSKKGGGWDYYLV